MALATPTAAPRGLGRGVHEDPSEDAPEVVESGDEDPSWMGGEAEATVDEGDDEAELGTGVEVDNRDVVDKSEM